MDQRLSSGLALVEQTLKSVETKMDSLTLGPSSLVDQRNLLARIDRIEARLFSLKEAKKKDN